MTEFVFHNFQQILNHFLKTQESELPFSHKRVVSIKCIGRILLMQQNTKSYL